MKHVLYKNPTQLDTLACVQFLFSKGIDARPSYCVERNHPSFCTQLPTINCENGECYIGLARCLEFYRKLIGFETVAELNYQVNKFKKENEERGESIRINDKILSATRSSDLKN
jgi:hypothetical protein